MLTKDQHIALNRFGLGASQNDFQAVINQSPIDWVLNQISKKNLPKLNIDLSAKDYLGTFQKYRQNPNKKDQMKFRQQAGQSFRDTISQKVNYNLSSNDPFLERLDNFWANHFTISTKGKSILTGLIADYENVAIRPHICGSFSDMLIAVVQHPAMLVYLDNFKSFGPNSLANRFRNIGLNENLAREILELHTLDVDGGYSQDDVISLAKIISGWSIDKGEFTFREKGHEQGSKTLLGQTYNQGLDDGVKALHDLASHPSTARFIAFKLAQHFIADNPRESDISALENTFLKTNGDLPSIYETLVMRTSIWDQAVLKYKSPYDYLVSSLRTLNMGGPAILKMMTPAFALLSQLPYSANSPAGWPDTEQYWLSPDNLKNRLEWAHAVSSRVPNPQTSLNHMLATIQNVSDDDSYAIIKQAPSIQEGLALALISPGHQRR